VNNIFEKLRLWLKNKGIPSKNLSGAFTFYYRVIDGVPTDYEQPVMAPRPFHTDIPYAFSEQDELYYHKDPSNPLELHFFIQPDFCEYVHGVPVVFRTSLQEILADPLLACTDTSDCNESLSQIADALRELAAEMDKTLFHKAKKRRVRNNVLPLV
jgi:hypothetical protein